MRSSERRARRSIFETTTVAIMTFAMSTLSFTPLYAASPKRSPKQHESHIAKSEHAAVEAGKAIEHGVIAATRTVEHAVSPAAITKSVRNAYFAKKVPYGKIILREAKKNHIQPELVAAVIKQESKFKPHAQSSAGALGLMQLLPRTGHWMGARNLLNPSENIAAGAKYLRYLHDKFDGNVKKIIAAYNAGEGNVRRYGGVPPFRETRHYVRNVLNFRAEFAQAALGDSGV